MPLLQVPTTSDPFYDQVSELDGVNYLLAFRYNQREERWYLSFYTEEGEAIITGIKLVCNWPLTGLYRDARLPPGVFLVQSNVATDSTPPTLLELGVGRRCGLFYMPVTDATEALAEEG